MVVRECRNANFVEKCLFSKLTFLENYRLDDLGKGRNRNFGTFAVILFGKNINWVPVLES